MIPITERQLQKKLEKFSNLPSIPQIILKIKQISENPKSSAADLANCILSDHQLTSRILRMANSVYYGDFSGKINTVTHGIVLMGFRAVRNIAISMAVYEVVNKISKDSNFDIVGFWTRSLACGVTAKYLARALNKPKLIEVAFIGGFMHDIGQAILAGVYPDKYQEISRLDAESPDIYETERVLLGTDHLEVGEHVAGGWNLPGSLVKTISEHHRIGKTPSEKSSHLLVDLVYLGDRVYPHIMSNDVPSSTAYAALMREARELVGVSDEAMIGLLATCRDEVAEIAKELEIDIEGEFEKCSPVEGEEAAIRQQLTSKEVQLAFLQNAAGALTQAGTDDEIMQVICEATFRGLQMGRVVLFDYDPKWSTFTGRVGFGFESQQSVQTLNFSSKKGLFRHLRADGEPVSVAGNNPEVYGEIVDPEDFERLEATAFAAVPIKIMDEVRHVLFADCANREQAIDDDTLRSMISLATQGGLRLERNYLVKKLEEVK